MVIFDKAFLPEKIWFWLSSGIPEILSLTELNPTQIPKISGISVQPKPNKIKTIPSCAGTFKLNALNINFLNKVT